MARTTAISFDDVARVAGELASKGTNPTNQAIRDALGGSFATITPLLKQWKAQNAPAPASTGLSPAFATAIQNEIDKQLATATATLRTQLDEANASIESLAKEGKDTAEELEDSKKIVTTLKQNIATLQGQMTEMRKQADAEKQRADTAEKMLTDAKIEAARNEGLREIVDTLKAQLAASTTPTPAKK